MSAQTLTEEQVEEISRRCDYAYRHICVLAGDCNKWRMSIPVQQDDSDILLGDVCRDVTRLIAERKAMQERIAMFEDENDALGRLAGMLESALNYSKGRVAELEAENQKLKTLVEIALAGEKVKPSPDEDL